MRTTIPGALILLGLSAPAQSLPAPNPVEVIQGMCKNPSHIARGPIGVDLSDAKYHLPYKCDFAVITYHAERGTVMIQFAEKKRRTKGSGGHCRVCRSA